MNIEINFPFDNYTKGELIEFCFGKHADVDMALPLDTCHKIQEFHDDKSAHRWYVMDYTKNKTRVHQIFLFILRMNHRPGN
jgi:D-lyxose ketol-isomerase